MEEGVVNDLMRSAIGAHHNIQAAPLSRFRPVRSPFFLPFARPPGDCFDPAQLISGISGSGNNWACGAHHYGTSTPHTHSRTAAC